MIELVQIAFINVFAKVLKFAFEIGTNYFVSKEVYGHFAILLSYILISVKIVSFGLPNILIREFPKNNNNGYRSFLLFNASITILLVTIILFTIVYILKIDYLSDYIYIPFITLSMALLILYSTYLRSLGFVKLWIYLQDICWYLLYFIGLGILYMIGTYYMNIITILQLYSYAIIFSLILTLLIVRLKFSMLFISKISFSKIKYLIEHSFPVLFTGLTYLILSRIDVIMLGNYVDISLVGEYNIVARVTMQVLFFNQVIVAYYYPKLAKKFATKVPYEKIATYNTRFVLLSILSASLVSTVLYVFIVYFNLFSILKIVHKEELFVVFIIFLITQLIYSSISFYGHILLYIHKQKIEYLNNLFILIIGVGLNYILIPIYGVQGAAFGSGLAILLGNILEMFQVKYYTKIFFIDFKKLSRR